MCVGELVSEASSQEVVSKLNIGAECVNTLIKCLQHMKPTSESTPKHRSYRIPSRPARQWHPARTPEPDAHVEHVGACDGLLVELEVLGRVLGGMRGNDDRK